MSDNEEAPDPAAVRLQAIAAAAGEQLMQVEGVAGYIIDLFDDEDNSCTWSSTVVLNHLKSAHTHIGIYIELLERDRREREEKVDPDETDEQKRARIKADLDRTHLALIKLERAQEAMLAGKTEYAEDLAIEAKKIVENEEGEE